MEGAYGVVLGVLEVVVDSSGVVDLALGDCSSSGVVVVVAGSFVVVGEWE